MRSDGQLTSAQLVTLKELLKEEVKQLKAPLNNLMICLEIINYNFLNK